MKVCEKCLIGIESKEGRMTVVPIAVSPPNDKCDWCKEKGFRVLHEIQPTEL